jgi:sulfate adenylyltransferase large subunit
VTDLLRLATAGSVDDGKSTLIGRLLFDSKAVMADQLEHLEAVNARRGGEGPDLALLTDGLRAEREQGITIDVAYRHFATPRRRFILADTPGHAQYTRNMVTGASTAELAIVLVDVRNGVTEQSRRHAAVAKLLGIRHLTVAVNKMDLVDFAEEAFDGVVRQFLDLAALLDVHGVTFIPMSALLGDNVVERSARTPWYDGPALLEHLETVPLERGALEGPARLPVQTVLRARERHYAGRLAGGTLRPGDDVVVLPAGTRTTVAAVELPEGEVAEASAPASVAVRLADELDVGRGDLIAHAQDAPEPRRELHAEVCWLGDTPVAPGARLALKHTTRTVRARLDAIEGRLDLTTLDWAPADGLALNDVGRVRLRLGEEVMAEPYDRERAMGAFILIDEATNDTVGAGMVR